MPCGAVTLKFCKIDFLGQGNLHNFDICLTEAGLLRKVFKKKFHINAFRFTSVQVSNRDYLRKRSSYDFDIQGDHMNELQLLTLKGRVFSFTVNEPELVANGGKAQVTLRNITSRFDLKGDDAEELYVDKTFNGKFISGLVCKNGDLHMFSDKSERMKNMFHNRTCVNTAIGDDQDTKRLSTTVSVGTKIVDVSISNSHVLIIDIYGRLWAIGTNQWGQLGLGHLMDQSNPTLVSLRSDVARTISISASSSSSIILCEHKDGKICAYFAGKLNDEQIYGYTLCDDSEDEDDLLYHSSQSKVIDRFKMIDVSLPRQTNMVSMTNNQLLFVSRHQVNDNSCFLQLPTRSLTECKDLGINPFRYELMQKTISFENSQSVTVSDNFRVQLQMKSLTICIAT